MTRSGDEEELGVGGVVDEYVGVGVDEVQAGAGSPVT